MGVNTGAQRYRLGDQGGEVRVPDGGIEATLHRLQYEPQSLISPGVIGVWDLQKLIISGRLERWISWRALTRLPQVVMGTTSIGFGVALMASAHLGLGPWSTLAEGLSMHINIALGTADILLGVPVLIAWLAIKEQPGLGTLAGFWVVGIAINAGLAVIPEPDPIGIRLLMVAGGVVLVGLGSSLYLSADLGPGPRDGLMTGLHHRFGWSIRWIRTLIEGSVLLGGFVLGGTIGIGTVAMAFTVGPVIQAGLSLFDKEQKVMTRKVRGSLDTLI